MKELNDDITIVLNVVKQMELFTIDELLSTLVMENDRYYSLDIIEHVLLNHPNVGNCYGYFFWQGN